MFIPVPIPEIEFESFIFPGGEVHIKLSKNINYSKITKVIITHRIRSSADLILLIMAQSALKEYGITDFDLIIPYFPYARQDRICDEGEAFTLKIFATLINNLKFQKVYVLDAHSDVGPALLNHCINLKPDQFIQKIKPLDYLIVPDAGASKKADDLLRRLSQVGYEFTYGIIQCAKVRDPKTGKLTGFKVYEKSLLGRSGLLVDDICDGGGTFIGLAKELNKKDVGTLELYVSHGIFSKGFEELDKWFNHIYTTNSFSDFTYEKLTQFQIQL
jgi:ribose-phosphate pyrophosphokinase